MQQLAYGCQQSFFKLTQGCTVNTLKLLAFEIWFPVSLLHANILRGPLEESNVIVRDPLAKWNWCRYRGVRRILKRGVTYRKVLTRGRVREGDVDPPARSAEAQQCSTI